MKQFLINLAIPNYKNSFQPYLIRKSFLMFYTVCLLTVNFLSPRKYDTAYASSVSSAVLVEMLNNERRVEGLNSLNTDPRLVAAAYDKAADIFEKQYWSHFGPNGETPWQFIIASGYDYIYAGENLAKGFSSSEGVHNAWMASKTHRENILNSNYKDVGIAVVPGQLQGDYIILVVQMFGSLNSDVPVFLPESSSLSSGNEVEILYPVEGDILADNLTKVSGRAELNFSMVSLFNNEAKIADLICHEGVWDYKPRSSWDEGTHKIKVQDMDRRFSDEIEFIIDTVAPEVMKETFSSTLNLEGSYKKAVVSVQVAGEPSEVVLMADDFSKVMDTTDSNIYSVEVPLAAFENANKISIFAVDVAGNNTVAVINNNVLGSTTDNDYDQKGFLGINLGSDFAKIFNRLVIFFIVILLIVDSVYLFKLNILHTKGKMLFPMAIWILILGIGLTIGSGGTVY